MKKFFLNALSSFVGAWVAIVLAGVIAVLLVFAFLSKAGGGNVTVEENSVLEIDLSGTFAERDDAQGVSLLSIMSDEMEVPQSLETTLAAIKEAKDNDRIKSIYLNCGMLSAAPATLQSLRMALIDFKQSGKKIYAYADTYTQGAYYVATVADDISLNPAGSVNFHGLGGANLFFKSFFDKIGLQFQVVRVGKGKAAVEPYTCDSMSSVARQQTMQMLDTLWMQLRADITKARPAVTPSLMDSLINVEYVSQRPAAYILDAKLVDKLEYRHTFEARVARAAGQGDLLEERVTPWQLAQYAPQTSPTDKDQVAVLYAEGGIDDMMGGGGINSAKTVESILKLKEDENVKALVLRVNSPGGSAFGSEQIWEALQTFKKTGKPFVVSMGDYAASGGYYISAGADYIFANPMTITGSIGIFGLIPNIKGTTDKLGIHVETVGTNPAGMFPNFFNPLDTAQMRAMQSMVEDGYALFVKRCAEGRHVEAERIKQIADGRPLPALMALPFGLVDKLGNLDDAVAYAAKAAKLKDYNVVAYPEVELGLMQMLASMRSETSSLALLHSLMTDKNPGKVAVDLLSRYLHLKSRDAIRAEAALLKFNF